MKTTIIVAESSETRSAPPRCTHPSDDPVESTEPFGPAQQIAIPAMTTAPLRKPLLHQRVGVQLLTKSKPT